jgi:hypothetical protein
MDTGEIRTMLERLDDLLSDAASAFWTDDSPLGKIDEARHLIEDALADLTETQARRVDDRREVRHHRR